MGRASAKILVFLASVVLASTAGLASAESDGLGCILGKIDPPEMVRSVAALDRLQKKTIDGTVDPQTGRFQISGLAAGRRYDLLLETAIGPIEGVDLAVEPDSPGASTSQPDQSGRPSGLSDADRQAIHQLVIASKGFADEARILLIRGCGQRAVALVELLRTRPFHDSKPGEVIWRVEVWYFAKWYGGWARQPNREVVLHRRRMPGRERQQTRRTFAEQLGGIIAAAPAEAVPLRFAVPNRPDPSKPTPAPP